MRFHLLILGLVLAVVAAAEAQIPPAGTVNVKPAELEEVAIEQRLGAQLPLDLQFTDSEGKTGPLGRFFTDKPVILSLVYYECPMLCTLILNGLTSALRAMSFSAGQEFDVVTVSFDPDEGPELASAKKESYLGLYRRTGAETGWHFLTGDAAAVRQLSEAVGYSYKYDAATDEFAHAAAIMVLTPDGKIARYHFGVEYSARDLRLGLIEAAEHRIGSPVDQLLLFCFRYDPSTGQYTPIVLNLIRLGGVLTVLAMAVFVYVSRNRGGGSGPTGTRQQSKTSGQPPTGDDSRLASMTPARSLASATNSGQVQ